MTFKSYVPIHSCVLKRPHTWFIERGVFQIQVASPPVLIIFG